jgi:hypothetical protein
MKLGFYDVSYWNKKTILQLFGESTVFDANGKLYNSPSTSGTLHLLAFYFRGLTYQEILQNYHAKLLRSLPVVASQSVR